MWLSDNKILLTWGLLAVSLLAVYLFSPSPSPLISILTNLLFLTIFVVCLFIVFREKQWGNKIIFINFLLFSAYFLITGIYPLIGNTVFTSSEFARHYHYQYGTIYYHIFLLFAVAYLVIDLIFRQRGVLLKYAISLGIAGVVSFTYYGSFLDDPKHLLNNPDFSDWVAIDNASYELELENGMQPTVEEIAAVVTLSAWKDGKPVGELYESEKYSRIDELLPYVRGQNYIVLLYRPLHKANVYMNTFTIFLIFLFFAYQYRKDPPQGAYIEKIMFLILILVSLESLHSWAYVRSVEWSIFVDFFVLGQYLTFGVLVILTLFFGLRLRFISTVQGEFYEQQLVSNPQRITRWRDWVDNFVLSYIFNSQTLVGRLLAPGKARR
jgi:hypothetical protein